MGGKMALDRPLETRQAGSYSQFNLVLQGVSGKLQQSQIDPAILQNVDVCLLFPIVQRPWWV